MNKAEGIIFDMDGTLYPFKDGLPFERNMFGKVLHANIQEFFRNTFDLEAVDARRLYDSIHRDFDGEISLGLEEVFGIAREEFFGATWCMNAADFVVQQSGLKHVLGRIDTRRALLSAAPDLWVRKVLRHLGIASMFGDAVFSGEPDIRKPDPAAFRQIADSWNVDPRQIISVGDQEQTDILPAKSIGMITVRIATGTADSQADFVAADIHDAVSQLKNVELL